MSRFSLSSPFALFQSIVASDQDATSSSTSSSSAINNSSTSLSLSPAANVQSASIFGEIQQQQQQLTHRQQKQALRFHPSRGFETTTTTKQISKHLLELQREIKAEEDEIFADINSLLNDRSNLYSSFDADDDFEENGAISSGFIVNNPITSTPPPSQPQLQSHPTPPKATATPAEDEATLLGPHDEILAEVEVETAAAVDEDAEYHQQQEQLEQQQLQQEQSFQEAIQQQQRDIQELTSNLPKPCVFFLEGNCRRSDCKFSHDLSSIICKYWIEGFCFKGEMCPFSHSLTSLGGGRDSGMLDDENRSHLSEKQLNPTFAIESEADFPSLPLDAPAGLSGLLGDGIQLKNSTKNALTKTIKNQILSSNPAVVFKTTKKKRKKG